MSTMNVMYPTKSVFKNIISQVFTRVYNQLPLANIEYPFVVYEMTFRQNCPGIKLEVLIDIWDDSLGLIELNQKADSLIDKLDRINEANGDIHFDGSLDISRDIPTNEENLNRIQLIGTYDLYKVT